MVHVKFLLWAHDISIDSTDNTVNVFRIIEDMSVLGFPAALKSESTFFIMLERDIKDNPKFKCQIKIQLANEDLIIPIDVDVDFGKLKRNRVRVKISPLLFMQEGVISLSILHKDKELGSYTVDCVKRDMKQIETMKKNAFPK